MPSALAKQECPLVLIKTWYEEALFSEAPPDSLWLEGTPCPVSSSVLHSTGALGSLCVYICLLDCEDLGLAAHQPSTVPGKEEAPSVLVE